MELSKTPKRKKKHNTAKVTADGGAGTRSERRATKWGHSPKSWGNGGNIPLFPGLG
eukprot:COSAG06_NODE_63725_length_261_cov_0.962963_1_plen_55_part_10